MIVLEVNADGILAIEAESEPKVARHGHCPTSFLIAPERMQPPARNVHVFCVGRSIQTVQHSIDPHTMLVWNSARFGTGEEPGEALVAKGADHVTASANSNALLYSLSSNALHTPRARFATPKFNKEIIAAIPERRFSLPA